MVIPATMVALEPMEARASTTVSTSSHSPSRFRLPSALVASGYSSLVKTTPWPTNTSAPIETPAQMKLCEEILQRGPIRLPRWISTKGPMREPLSIRHP